MPRYRANENPEISGFPSPDEIPKVKYYQYGIREPDLKVNLL